ncbi:class I SAM-dependent methyltransferase [Natrialbaceae archaeon GCM10025810]|uniref:class I SAM-dependent methyltransferase n=1 Tax=Halovalidus salilacus TaxID=3075124 RepID=UPI003621B576
MTDPDETDDRTRWNEKYDDPEFQLPEEPIPELKRLIDELPDGRALDVATGTGRNALFLAERGYDVDAVDVSDEALERARERAADRGVEGNVTWIRADFDAFDLEPESYDVIAVSFFAALDRLPDLKEALAPDGVLVYEHHLRSADPIDVGPSSDRFRFRSNDLLRACLDLTVLYYAERRREVGEGIAADATIVARKSRGGRQSYPLVEGTE